MKNKLLILLIAMLALLLCFSACVQKPEEELPEEDSETQVTITSIEVVSGSVPATIDLDADPDFSGIKVKVNYSDGTSKEVGFADVTIGQVDTLSTGKKNVTVTYQGVSTQFSINVIDPDETAYVTSIKIVPGSIASAYYIDQMFDVSNLQVEATYNTGKVNVLSPEEYTYSTVDTSKVGEQTFTVTYTANPQLTASVKVNVLGIKSIKVITSTIASKINVGEKLDTSGLQVIVEFDDGRTFDVDAAGLTIGTIDTTSYGKKDLSITYKGVTIKHTIEVVGPVSITVNKGSYPEKVKVLGAYSAPDITGYVTFSDDTKKTLEAKDFSSISTIDTSKAGSQKLTVAYEGLETFVYVEIVGVSSLEVISGVSNEVLKGAALDASRIRVSVKYTDNTTDVVGADVLTLGAVDTTTAGEKKLSVTYLDKSIEYAVKVCEVTSIRVDGIAGSVQSGKPIDISQMKVYGIYNDTAKTAVELTDGTVTTNIDQIDKNSTEAKTLTVTYNGSYGQFTKDVIIYATAPELVDIEIRNFDPEVLLNAAYNTASVVVYANYGNETSARITSFDMTPVATSEAGDVSFTVTYQGKSATKTVKVCAITSLRIDNAPLYVPSGEEINIDGMKVYGVYNDTAKTAVELTDGTITTNINELNTTYIDSTEPRILTVKYTGMYGEHTATYTIDTTAPLLERVEIQSYKTEVLLGGAFSKSDVVVVAHYGNGQSVAVPADKFSMTPFATGVAGNVTFTVSFTDTENSITKTASATVKICKISSLRIEGVADSVQSGKPIDISGMKVYGVYDDTAETEVELTEGYTTNINELNVDSVINGTANRVLVVTYENGATGTLTISATAPELTGIEIVGWDNVIGLGGQYNKNSVQVEAIYGNGTSASITTGFTVADVATGTAGDTTLTVTYNGKTATKTVKVCAIASIELSGLPAWVAKGGTLDTTNIKVTVKFEGGAPAREVSVSYVTIALDTATAGDKKVEVNYLGFTQEADCHVRGVQEIKFFDDFNTIRDGHEVDFDNIMIHVIYTNGDEEQKKLSAIDGITKKEATAQIPVYDGDEITGYKVTVTIKHADATEITRDLKVIKLAYIHALTGSIPASVLQGAEFTLSNIKIALVYDNGETHLINSSDYSSSVSITSIDTATAGNKAIKISYTENGETYETEVIVTVLGVSEVIVVPGTVRQKLYVGETLAQDKYLKNLLVKVVYSDGSYTYVKHPNVRLEIASLPNTTTEGTAKLVVKYLGVEGEIAVSIVARPENSGSSGFIFGTLRPDELVARDSYKGNFKDDSSPYYVGDDNKYYFYLNVIILDSNNNIVETDGKSEPVALTVTMNGSTVLDYRDSEGKVIYSAGGVDYLVFDPSDNGYDFTDAAIGNKYELKIKPKDSSRYVDENEVTQSHTVTVVDGYNVYEAWELNVMTNVTADITDGAFGAEGKISQVEVVDKYLKAKGVTRPERLAAIIIHGNLDVTVDDLPPEYFYGKEGDANYGLYDFLGLFSRNLSTSEKSFKIYGNYYSVYSYSIPCVVPKGVANNKDDYSSSDLFKIRLSGEARQYVYNSKRADAFGEFVIDIRDIATRDNDPNSNDQSASERHMRGLACYKVREADVNMYNVNVDAYMTSMIVENVGSDINLTNVKFYNSWQGHLFLWSYNEIQVDYGDKDAVTEDFIPNLKVEINNSLLAKSGGPVILAQAPNVNYASERTCGVEVTADAASEIWTYVTGQEAWFVAVGQTQMATQVRAMSPLISKTVNPQTGTPLGIPEGNGFTSTAHIQGVETVNMMMVAMGNAGTGLEGAGVPNASFKKDGVQVMLSHHDQNKKTFQNAALDVAFDTVYAMSGQVAPIFEASNGGLAYTDGSVVGALNAQFNGTGDFITLYYKSVGAGIAMEYYHPKQGN